jgi:hypothetical protein
MPIGAAELLLAAGAVALLFWLLTPLRRRLEIFFTRRLRGKRPTRSARVVVLQRRKDGTFVQGDGNGR